MNTRLLLLALLCSCGSEETDSRYGIFLHDDTSTVTIEQADRGIDHVLMVIGGKGKQLEGITLSVENDPLPLDGADGVCKYPASDEHGPTGKCAGGLTYLDGNTTRVWKNMPCWSRSTWVHELCHWFQLFRDGADDIGHVDPEWWDNGSPDSGTRSVEGIARHSAIMEECPDSP